MTPSGQELLPGLDQLTRNEHRTRPPHYLVITCDWAARDDPDTESIVVEVELTTDDEQRARSWAADSVGPGSHDGAVWDNWTGCWLVEADWCDDVEVAADGFARYDLRPDEHLPYLGVA